MKGGRVGTVGASHTVLDMPSYVPVLTSPVFPFSAALHFSQIPSLLYSENQI